MDKGRAIGQSDWCSGPRRRVFESIVSNRRRYHFLSRLSEFADVKCAVEREVSLVRLHLVTMAPSTQTDDTVSGVRKGIRAILLGPPGAGKGTQVRVHEKGRVAHSD